MIDPTALPTEVAALTPQRNENLLQRLARAVFNLNPQTGPQTVMKETTETGIAERSRVAMYDQFFRAHGDRLAIYKDVDEMDVSSEECSVALDIITDNSTTSEDGSDDSFVIKCKDTKDQDVIDEAVHAARLDTMIHPIIRNFLKYGDGFNELIVNDEFKVVGTKIIPPSTMYRNQDPSGRLRMADPEYDQGGIVRNKQGECAFEQRMEDTQTIVATFYPFQIAHVRWNWDGIGIYGNSMLRSSRIIWKKLHAIDEALIIARLVRAYMKLVHYVDTTGLSLDDKKKALKAYKESITQRQQLDGRRDLPWWVLTDIFVATGMVNYRGEAKPSQSKVDVIDPKNEAMGKIDDITQYLYRKFLATLRVPPAYFGIESEINAKATLTNQDVEYIRFLREIQRQAGQQYLRQFIEVALTAAGRDPFRSDDLYEIVWPRLSATDEAAAADTEWARAQADQFYSGAGVIDTEWMQRNRFDMQDEQIEEINQRVQDAKDEALKLQQQQTQDAQAHQLKLATVKGSAPVVAPPPNGKGTAAQTNTIKTERANELAREVKGRIESRLRGRMGGLLSESRHIRQKLSE